MAAASFHNIVKQLTDGQTPRVWSLLVTVFGELAQDEGAQISGLLLRRIRELIGIKPEAMRVALHRLRKDGWIENARTGRTSAHFLTDWGRAQSVAASPRIYSPQATAQQAWLVLCDPAQPHGDTGESGVWLSSNLLLSAQPTAHPEQFATLLTQSTPLPDWMKAKVCDPQTIAKARDFADMLTSLQKQLPELPPLDPIEQAVLRVLLVHAWRRIVLKAPELPDFVYPDDWSGPQCRAGMAALLGKFPKRELDTLEQSLDA